MSTQQCLWKVKMKHNVRSSTGEESSAQEREWPSLRKCPGIPCQQQGIFTVLPARTQLPTWCLQRQGKASLWPLHGLHSTARLLVPLHCSLGMEMWQVQPPKNLLGSFQVIVSSHWQQTSRLFRLVQRQNKYLRFIWLCFTISNLTGKQVTCKYKQYLTYFYYFFLINIPRNILRIFFLILTSSI